MKQNRMIIREFKEMEWNEMYLSKGNEWKRIEWCGMEWNFVTLIGCFKIKE